VKAIAQRVWNEPAVAIGLFTSIVLVVLALVSDADWDAQTIVGVIAPFASALGIRPLVTPTAKMDEPPPALDLKPKEPA